MEGNTDSSADITTVNDEVFKKVVAVACLWKKQFKSADMTPVGYDN